MRLSFALRLLWSPDYVPSLECYKYNNIRLPYTYAYLIRWVRTDWSIIRSTVFILLVFWLHITYLCFLFLFTLIVLTVILHILFRIFLWLRFIVLRNRRDCSNLQYFQLPYQSASTIIPSFHYRSARCPSAVHPGDPAQAAQPERDLHLVLHHVLLLQTQHRHLEGSSWPPPTPFPPYPPPPPPPTSKIQKHDCN